MPVRVREGQGSQQCVKCRPRATVTAGAAGALRNRCWPVLKDFNHEGNTMEHTLPPLPYAIDALAPHYSQETLEYHLSLIHI